MLRMILTGQARSADLLEGALLAFLSFLPSLLAFRRGHSRFLVVLGLNVALASVLLLAFVAPLGIGWVLLLGWAVRPGVTDARLIRAQDTKLYDAVAALPLMLWFAYCTLQLLPTLANDAALIGSGAATLPVMVRFPSLLAAAAYNLLLVYLLVVRDKPVRKSRGVLPRFCGTVGTFLSVGLLQLPVAPLGLGLQVLAAALIGVGSLLSFLVAYRLGKSFSILPEARRLVTDGPYACTRHPLYAVELLPLAGAAIQFASPWAALIGGAVVALAVIRSLFEERVLMEAYPEYAAYRSRTPRFIPRWR
jgi:protein-S-isoprenylcysteine O-methyltransferase Ste14